VSLTPGAPAPAGSVAAPGAPAAAATPPVSGNQLATVDIASRRPTDVGTDAAAPNKAAPAGPTMGSGATPSQPVIPLQGTPGTTMAKAAPVTKTPEAKAPEAKAAPTPAPAVVKPASAPAAVPSPAVAAAPAAPAAGSHAIYVLNLSAYANASSVDHLVRRVRGFGYPVLTRMVTQAGKQLTLVTAGPFDSRTAAEAARLKITQAIPDVPAKLVEGLGHADSAIAATPVKPVATHAATATTPARAPVAAPRASGFAVQLAALGSEADANALRDKLRAAGFDGFVDTVGVGGKTLWRVRAGPHTQRADAERVRDQIKAKLGIAGNVVNVP
jgi:cell division septation protein DedD